MNPTQDRTTTSPSGKPTHTYQPFENAMTVPCEVLDIGEHAAEVRPYNWTTGSVTIPLARLKLNVREVTPA